MFFAALTSRSCRAPHDGHVQCRVDRELLTGKTVDQQLADPASRPLIASGDDDNPLIVKLEDGFVCALAGADRSELDSIAVPWSQIEEFGGTAAPAPG